MTDWPTRHAAGLERRRREREAERERRRLAWHAEHDAILEQRRLARAGERERVHTRNREGYAQSRDPVDHDEDFEQEMADKLSITVVDFRELQGQRRRELADKPQIGYAPDHEVH